MKPAWIILGYAAFIFSSGFFGWAMTGFSPGSKTALIAATVFSAPLLLCGLMALALPRRRSVGLVGAYLGMVLPLVVSAVYGWRAYLALFEQSNIPKGITISIMALAGIVAAALVYKTLPRREPNRTAS